MSRKEQWHKTDVAKCRGQAWEREEVVSVWIIASSGMRWAFLNGGEEDGKWITWQREGKQDSSCQLLITLIEVIS